MIHHLLNICGEDAFPCWYDEIIPPASTDLGCHGVSFFLSFMCTFVVVVGLDHIVSIQEHCHQMQPNSCWALTYTDQWPQAFGDTPTKISLHVLMHLLVLVPHLWYSHGLCTASSNRERRQQAPQSRPWCFWTVKLSTHHMTNLTASSYVCTIVYSLQCKLQQPKQGRHAWEMLVQRSSNVLTQSFWSFIFSCPFILDLHIWVWQILPTGSTLFRLPSGPY